MFYKDDGELVYDKTLDVSSFYGLILFDVSMLMIQELKNQLKQ
jgi:hypothetical protein